MRSKKPFRGSKPLACLLIICGAVVLGITVLMNYHFGSSLALSDSGKQLQAGAAIAIDCAAALFAFALGRMLVNKHWIGAAIMGVIVAMFVSYSMIGIVGFGASERFAKAELIRLNNHAAAEQVDKANQRAVAVQEGQLKWMRDMYGQADSKADKGRLIAAMKDTAQAAPEVKVVKVQEISDPQALVLSTVAGRFSAAIDVIIIQLSQVLWLAILLATAKPTCITLAGIFWGTKEGNEPSQPDMHDGFAHPDTAKATVLNHHKNDGLVPVHSVGLDDDPTDPTPNPPRSRRKRSSEPDTTRHVNGSQVLDASPVPDGQTTNVVALPVTMKRRAVANLTRPLPILRAFFGEAMKANPSARIGSSDLYKHFSDWARRHELPIMSHTTFGITLRRMRIEKARNTNRRIYLGWSIITVDGREVDLAVNAA
jgi:hypothetical protein